MTAIRATIYLHIDLQEIQGRGSENVSWISVLTACFKAINQVMARHELTF